MRNNVDLLDENWIAIVVAALAGFAIGRIAGQTTTPNLSATTLI